MKVKGKNELKETGIKNRACYYFDDIINGTDIILSNILLDKKLYENISVYKISNKTQTGPKPSPIRFNKIDEFIMFLMVKLSIYYVLYYIEHLLSIYVLLDKICNKIKSDK